MGTEADFELEPLTGFQWRAEAEATLIAVGVPGSQMNAYSLDYGGPLTSEQIKAVVADIRAWEEDAPDRPDWRDMVGG